MPDLNLNPLPLAFITEASHANMLKKILDGDRYEMYRHWIAAGHTLHQYDVKIKTLENTLRTLKGEATIPLNLPVPTGVDKYGTPLPEPWITQGVHDQLITKIEAFNLLEIYSHWIAAAHSLVLFSNRVKALEAEISTHQSSDRVIKRFLWKPSSEGGAPEFQGKVVVLVDLEGVDVIANGIPFKDTGPSNGRGTTSRTTLSCDKFTGPVKITFQEKDGKKIKTKHGVFEVIVNDPCNRLEWN